MWREAARGKSFAGDQPSCTGWPPAACLSWDACSLSSPSPPRAPGQGPCSSQVRGIFFPWVSLERASSRVFGAMSEVRMGVALDEALAVERTLGVLTAHRRPSHGNRWFFSPKRKRRKKGGRARCSFPVPSMIWTFGSGQFFIFKRCAQ